MVDVGKSLAEYTSQIPFSLAPCFCWFSHRVLLMITHYCYNLDFCYLGPFFAFWNSSPLCFRLTLYICVRKIQELNIIINHDLRPIFSCFSWQGTNLNIFCSVIWYSFHPCSFIPVHFHKHPVSVAVFLTFWLRNGEHRHCWSACPKRLCSRPHYLCVVEEKV